MNEAKNSRIDPQIYFEQHNLGFIDSKMEKMMEWDAPVRVKTNRGMKQVVTMDILLTWWLIYAGLNNMIDSNGDIKPDDNMIDLFGEDVARV